jgi:hypothetical protein
MSGSSVNLDLRVGGELCRLLKETPLETLSMWGSVM